jgi:hypothetical protein
VEEKDPADKTWVNFKVHSAAAHSHHNHMQGESSVKSGYHAANAAMGQTEAQMAGATIGALVNVATATSTYRGVVSTFNEANSRLDRQVEDCSNELKEVKALLKKERA